MRRMALLRNLEQSLSGFVEGTIGRVFRTEVRPTEIARKLAREMEINKRVSLSKTYAPTDYLVYLSPDDRSRYTGVEASIAEELGAYLLEHARRERLVLVRRPLVEFRTDERLRLGEFGIEARTTPISAAEAPPREEPGAGEDAVRGPREGRPRRAAPSAEVPFDVSGEDVQGLDAPYADPSAGDSFAAGAPAPEEAWDQLVDPLSDEDDWLDPVEEWAPEPPAAGPPAPAFGASAPWIDPTLQRREGRQPPAQPTPPPPAPRTPETTLLIDGTPHLLHGNRLVIGRSRSSDIVIPDPSVSRQHLELRRDDRGWYAVDLGTTNGSELNGQSLTSPRRLEPGQRIRLGHAAAIIEVR